MMIFYASLLLVFLNGETQQPEIIPAGTLEDCAIVVEQLEKRYLPNPAVKFSLPQCDYRAAPK